MLFTVFLIKARLMTVQHSMIYVVGKIIMVYTEIGYCTSIKKKLIKNLQGQREIFMTCI